MPRRLSPLTLHIRETLATLADAHRWNVPLDDARELRQTERAGLRTRREFLATAGAALTIAVASRPARAASTSRIIVVGGGLAGLRFAHAMYYNNALKTTVYEANPSRNGGRVFTNRGYFPGGLIAEHGAEFISSEHTSMRALAAQFGWPLATVNGGSESCCNDAYWLDGSSYTQHQLNADLAAAQPTLCAAYNSAPFPQTWNNHTAAAATLDNTSAHDWIEANIAGGTGGKLGRIMLTSLLSEYGCEPATQSALNLIYLLGGPGGSGGGGLAGTDEKYKVAAGNDKIVTSLVSALPAGTLKTGYALIKLALNSDGTYTCTFQKGASTTTAIADHVILALPFSRIKLIDVSQAGFSSTKLLAINNYALGTNAKLALGMNTRPWSAQDGYSGVCYSDPASFQLCWDASVSQKGPKGILVQFPAGTAGGPNAFPGAAPHGSTGIATYAANCATAANAPFPGVSTAYNGKAYLDWWATDPYIGGAYGCYQAGQITTFSGIEPVKEGNVHFCGEQTSAEFQGYMEGAVRSAECLSNNWPNM